MNRFFNSPGSKENAPRMIGKDKGYWYMCSRPRGWELKLRPHGFNAGDCCWWTGLSVLGYDDDLLLQGLLQLTPIKGGAWRRHPFGEDLENTIHPVHEFTRDHLIYAITALVVKANISAKQAIRLTPRRLSQRTRIALPLWSWLKAIENEGTFKGKVYAKLFSTLTSPIVFAGALYSLMIKSILGKKAQPVHPNDKITPPVKFKAKHLQWIADNMRLFPFQGHLWALQVHAMRELELTTAPIMSWGCRLYMGKFNYLVQLLTGKKLNKSIIKDYESRVGWMWQSWMDNITGNNEKCTKTEAKHNALDKDILWKMYDKL